MIVVGRYDGGLRALVHRFKFRGETALGVLLGEMMADAVRASGRVPGRIAPVPLHWRRRWGRGYDQAAILARHAGRALGRPVEARRLRRRRATAPQSRTGDAAARAANVEGAFVLGRGPVSRGSWLLVDDVLSTGATAAECAALLRRAGASRVEVAALGR